MSDSNQHEPEQEKNAVPGNLQKPGFSKRYPLDLVVHKFVYPYQPEPYGQGTAKKVVTCRINPGGIFPNYIHTWALDVRFSEPADDNPDPVDSFTLHFEEIQLDWGSRGDVLTVLNANGDELQTYRSFNDIVEKEFKCGFTDADTPPYKRIYLVLETSNKTTERRMILKALATETKPPPTAEIRLVEDDINYETADPFVDARDPDENPIKLYAPWLNKILNPDKTEEEGAPAGPEKPLRSEGWYLVGENVNASVHGFYSLLYYNEYDSRLRAYLYNIDMPDDAAGFILQVALAVKKGYEIEHLKGAFFPVDPNPDNWSTAVAVIPKWPLHSWTMIEIPVLYPMGENLPVDPAFAAKPPPGEYCSLYEDRFVPGAKNVMIRLQAAPVPLDQLRTDAIGKAIDGAIREFEVSLLADIIDKIYTGIKQGKEWYNLAGIFAGAVINRLNTDKENWGASAEQAEELIAKGAAAFAGPLGTASAAMSPANTVPLTPESIRLALELAMQGKLPDRALDSEQAAETLFFLPGRFSIKEAFEQGLPKGGKRFIDSVIPRYDRAIGLFGFKQNPGNTSLSIYRLDKWPYREDAGCSFIIPDCVVRPYFWTANPWSHYYIPSLLPVIYNPFSRIEPLPNRCCNEDPGDGQPFSSIYCKAFFDPPTWDLIDGSSGIGHEPSRGFRLDLYDTYKPNIYRTYEPYTDSRVISTVWRLSDQSQEPGLIGFQVFRPFPDEVYMLMAKCGTGRSAEKWDEHFFDPDNLSPLHDIIYYWTVAYQAFDHNHKPVGIRTFTLSSPVSITLLRALYQAGEDGKPQPYGKVRSYAVKSALLRKVRGEG